MKNDLYYAKNISFLMDVKIVLQTIRVVLKHENIYKDEDPVQQIELEIPEKNG